MYRRATQRHDTGRGKGRKVVNLMPEPRNVAAAVSGQFSGTAYVVGVPTTGLNSDGTKPYVKCNLATGAATEDAGPMPNPFDHDEEWFEKANTYGDIHAIR